MYLAYCAGIICLPSLLRLLSLRLYCGISNHVQYELIPNPY